MSVYTLKEPGIEETTPTGSTPLQNTSEPVLGSAVAYPFQDGWPSVLFDPLSYPQCCFLSA
jgi:hypothetical protein